jgi:predicted transcriptional regulator of viral defense system
MPIDIPEQISILKNRGLIIEDGAVVIFILTNHIKKYIFSVNMKNAMENTQRLADFAPKVGGVFSLSELGALFDISSQQRLWIAVRQFEAAGLLKRYCRGIYVARDFDPQVLSAKVRTDSYISFGSALAYHRLIGTESPFLVSCVVPSRASEFTGDVNLSYARISKELFFGMVPLENGVKMADAEKAVLDTLYFYQHKKNFYFNVFQDIEFAALSRERMNMYLDRYANPKFRAFARNTVYGKV